MHHPGDHVHGLGESLVAGRRRPTIRLATDEALNRNGRRSHVVCRNNVLFRTIGNKRAKLRFRFLTAACRKNGVAFITDSPHQAKWRAAVEQSQPSFTHTSCPSCHCQRGSPTTVTMARSSGRSGMSAMRVCTTGT